MDCLDGVSVEVDHSSGVVSAIVPDGRIAMEFTASLESCSEEMLHRKPRRSIEGHVGCSSGHTRDFLRDPEICWCGRTCHRPEPNCVMGTATIDVVERLQR